LGDDSAERRDSCQIIKETIKLHGGITMTWGYSLTDRVEAT